MDLQAKICKEPYINSAFIKKEWLKHRNFRTNSKIE
jgi:hypothetical protein